MATPTGTISLSDVNIELRRKFADTISMDSTEVRALARRPAGVNGVSMDALRGKSILELGNESASGIFGQFGGGAQATASISFNSNGTITLSATGATTIASSWSIITSTGLSTSGGGYEIQLDNSSLSGGTISAPGGWSTGNEIIQDIGSGVTWTLSVTNPGSGDNPKCGSFSADVLIREKTNVNVFVTASVSLTAQVTDLSRPIQ